MHGYVLANGSSTFRVAVHVNKNLKGLMYNVLYKTNRYTLRILREQDVIVIVIVIGPANTDRKKVIVYKVIVLVLVYRWCLPTKEKQ